MEQLENNIYLIPILSVFLSGLFGLLVTVVTWNLASKREKEKFKQELIHLEFKEKEELYISILSSLDKIIIFTKNGKDYADLYNDFTFITAKVQILATESINMQFRDISDILYSWSSEYKQSLPKKIEGMNLGLISNLNFEHREKADEIFPDLLKLIKELITSIKKELDYLKNEIKK